MKRRAMAARALALAGVCACASLPRRSDVETDQQMIRALLSEYDASWATHDAERRLKLFAPDAEITNVVGETMHGVAGLREIQSSARYRLMYADAVEKFDSVSIRPLAPSIAFVIAHWTMTGAKKADGTVWADRRGYVSLVLKKTDGNWLIEKFANAEIPARP